MVNKEVRTCFGPSPQEVGRWGMAAKPGWHFAGDDGAGNAKHGGAKGASMGGTDVCGGKGGERSLQPISRFVAIWFDGSLDFTYFG